MGEWIPIFVNTWFTLASAAETIEVEVRFYYLHCCNVRVRVGEYGPGNGGIALCTWLCLALPELRPGVWTLSGSLNNIIH